MSNKTAALVFGILGAICGAAVCCRFFEEKYKRIADEEIASVKSTFARRTFVNICAKDCSPDNNADVKKNIDYSGVRSDPHTSNITDDIYSINPEQFGEFEDYAKISLVYFSDGVLASDDNYEKITPARSNVGSSRKLALYFEDDDTDCVYIRNDNVRTDYEVVRDERSYDDVCTARPYLRRE